MSLPQEAIDAAMKAVIRVASDFGGENEIAGDAPTIANAAVRAAAPLIAAEALRTAAREQHEDAIRALSDEVWAAEKPRLLAEVAAATDERLERTAALVRAAERKRIITLARKLGATYPVELPPEPGSEGNARRASFPFADYLQDVPVERQGT